MIFMVVLEEEEDHTVMAVVPEEGEDTLEGEVVIIVATPEVAEEGPTIQERTKITKLV